MKLDDIMAHLGMVDVDEWPTYRAARLAAELMEEFNQLPPPKRPETGPRATPKFERSPGRGNPTD